MQEWIVAQMERKRKSEVSDLDSPISEHTLHLQS